MIKTAGAPASESKNPPSRVVIAKYLQINLCKKVGRVAPYPYDAFAPRVRGLSLMPGTVNCELSTVNCFRNTEFRVSIFQFGVYFSHQQQRRGQSPWIQPSGGVPGGISFGDRYY